MEHERSFVYTLILGACMLISLLLVGKMLLYEPAPIHVPHMSQPQAEQKIQPQDTEDTNMIITAQDAAGMILEKLPQTLAPEQLTVGMGADGSLSIAGTVQKSAIESQLSNQMAQSILMFLPDRFDLKLSSMIQCAADGIVTLTPVTLSAGPLELPGSAIPQDLLSVFNTAVNDALHSTLGEFSAINMQDGAMELIP